MSPVDSIEEGKFDGKYTTKSEASATCEINHTLTLDTLNH